jgi:hypothetical protein
MSLGQVTPQPRARHLITPLQYIGRVIVTLPADKRPSVRAFDIRASLPLDPNANIWDLQQLHARSVKLDDNSTANGLIKAASLFARLSARATLVSFG